MEESTDVDRMLARLGEGGLRYREFTDPIARSSRTWSGVPSMQGASAVAPAAGAWNMGPGTTVPPAPRLATEPLRIDPEAPGGAYEVTRSAVAHSQFAPDRVDGGRTPPAPLDAVPDRIGDLPPPAVASAKPGQTGLSELFQRVSGTGQPARTEPNGALSGLFKRLS